MGVQVENCPAMSQKAVAFADNFLVLGQLEDDREALTVLTHEKWHYKLGAFYPLDATYGEKCRAEARVEQHALRELVPKEELTRLLQSGMPAHEIAEALEVPETLILEAWYYYRDTDAHFGVSPNEA